MSHPREIGSGRGPFAHIWVEVWVGVVRLYRLVVSPWLGPACRFHPTCSEYAIEALRTHGPLRGGWLAVRRLGRCHPLGGDGFDPVPQRGIGGP